MRPLGMECLLVVSEDKRKARHGHLMYAVCRGFSKRFVMKPGRWVKKMLSYTIYYFEYIYN